MRREVCTCLLGIVVLTFAFDGRSRPPSPSDEERRLRVSMSARSAKTPLRSGEARPLTPVRMQGSLSIARMPLLFEPNEGQMDPQVRFLSRASGFNLFLLDSEIVLALDAAGKAEPRVSPGRPVSGEPRREGAESTPVVLRMRLAGAQPAPRIYALERAPTTVNYFMGTDPEDWRGNIPAFAKVKYEDVYPGVDLLFYGRDRELEFDLILAPYADPKSIHLAFEGAEQIRVDTDGHIRLRASHREMLLHRPIIYQGEGGSRREVRGRYLLGSENRVGFELESYNPEAPLIIDPVLSFSTFLGGTGMEFVSDLAIDSAGHAYVTGFTGSASFLSASPLHIGPGGNLDLFVMKLDSSGAYAHFLTYIGGSGEDVARAIRVDPSGHIYILGDGDSNNFPTTPGAFQQNSGGGGSCLNDGGFFTPCRDAFILKLDAGGATLLYSTYLGGQGDDVAGSGRFALDPDGNVYVTGSTNSVDFPRRGALQPAYGGGRWDAFLAKLNPTGSELIYSTFLGGTDRDYGLAVTIDGAGSAYLTGQTGSPDFPIGRACTGPFAGGILDPFVTKIDPSGSMLVYCRYLGGSGYDAGVDIELDTSGNAYIVGHTNSVNLPTTPGAYRTTFQGTSHFLGDAFVVKLDSLGDIIYATYLGASGDDIGIRIAVDAQGRAHIAGYTDSANLPLVNPIAGNDSYRGGSLDAFVMRLTPTGSDVDFSTYLGGSHIDRAVTIALDLQSGIFVGGITASPDFPTTLGAFQPSFSGSGPCSYTPCGDGFVARIVDNRPPAADAGADQVLACASANATAVILDGSGSADPDGNTLSYQWRDAAGNVVGTTAQVMLTLPLGSHSFTLTVNDGRGGTDSDTVAVGIFARVEGFRAPLAALVLDGESVPYPDKAFKLGRTLPLRLNLFCGSGALTDYDVSAPRIVGLTRNGDALDLALIDLDAGQSNDSGTQFRYSDGNWVFNLSTAGVGTGTYVVTVQTPDGRRYLGGFVLR